MNEVKAELDKTGKLPQHLDSENDQISLMENATALLDTKGKPIVSANVYLGARGIIKGRLMPNCSYHYYTNADQHSNSVLISSFVAELPMLHLSLALRGGGGIGLIRIMINLLEH